jgi:hypothetical protein
VADPWNVNIHYDGKLDQCVSTRVAELRRHVSAELPGARVSLLPLGRVFVQWQAP